MTLGGITFQIHIYKLKIIIFRVVTLLIHFLPYDFLKNFDCYMVTPS